MNTHLLKQRLNELVKSERRPYLTDYDSSKVNSLALEFLGARHLTQQYSVKRKGWIIDCPASSTHTHNDRFDDCCVYLTEKGNGFIFISLRCRHSSCGDAITDFAKELNKEWGTYLNAHY